MVNKIKLANNVAGNLCKVVSAWKEYNRIHEEEAVKREYIKAQRDIALARINAQKEFLESCLVNTFKERRCVIEGLFMELNKGIELGDDKIIGSAISGIVSIVQISPLKSVDDFMKQVNNPEVREIEI